MKPTAARSMTEALAEAAGLAARAKDGARISVIAAAAFLARWRDLPTVQQVALRRFLEAKKLLPEPRLSPTGPLGTTGQDATADAPSPIEPVNDFVVIDAQLPEHTNRLLERLARPLTREYVSDVFCEEFGWTYQNDAVPLAFDSSPLVARWVREATIVARWGDLLTIRVLLREPRPNREEMRRIAVWLDRQRGGSLVLFVDPALLPVGLATIALGLDDGVSEGISVPLWDMRDSEERSHAAVSLVRRFWRPPSTLSEQERADSTDPQRRAQSQTRELARESRTRKQSAAPEVDVVAVFLRDMGRHRLLRRDEEVALARSIAGLRRSTLALVFSSKPARDYVRRLRDNMAARQMLSGEFGNQAELDADSSSEEQGEDTESASDLDASSEALENVPTTFPASGDTPIPDERRIFQLLDQACALADTDPAQDPQTNGSTRNSFRIAEILDAMPLSLEHVLQAFRCFQQKRTELAQQAKEIAEVEQTCGATAEIVIHLAGELGLHGTREDQRICGRLRMGPDKLRVTASRLLTLANTCSCSRDELGMSEAEASHHVAAVEAALVDLRKARDHFVSTNLRLVVSIAKRFAYRHPNPCTQLPDLIQAGAIGLMRAVDGFDPERGYKFSTYATWWIRQSISRTVANDGRTIRFPVHLEEQVRRAQRAYRKFETENQRAPTDRELAGALNLPLDRIRWIRALPLRTLSLDREDSFGEPLVERVGRLDPTPEQALIQNELNERVRQKLLRMPAREQIVLRRRHGIGMSKPETLEEIGKVFGVTRERIRQIESNAEAGMQQLLTDRFAAEYGIIPHPVNNALARQRMRRKAKANTR